MPRINFSALNSDTDIRRGRVLGDKDEPHDTTWAFHIDPTLGPEQVRADRIKYYFSVSDCYLDCPYFVSSYVLLVNAFRYEFDPDFVLINVCLQKIQYLTVELSEMGYPFFTLFGPID